MALGGFYSLDAAPLDLRPPFPPIVITHGRAYDVVPVSEVRSDRRHHETAIDHHLDPTVKPALRPFLDGVARSKR
jgi:hypothetical protein